jgi:predicted Kef-type K+ transport protein
MPLSFQDLLGQKEFWAFLFVLGWLLLNWPMLTLTDGVAVMGVPAILIYITAVWLFIILILYQFDRENSE